MASQTKMKVRTADLLAAVKKRRTAEVQKHERDLRAYEQRAAKQARNIAQVLRKAADEAERGVFPEISYRRIEVPYKGENLSKPELNTARIDRLIKTLEMAAEDSLSISADDAAQYLG